MRAGPERDQNPQNTKGVCSMLCEPLIFLVPPARLERATTGLGIRCSIRLSYGGMNRSG